MKDGHVMEGRLPEGRGSVIARTRTVVLLLKMSRINKYMGE